ncbi:MAG: hypothetical protein K2K89_05245 [Ruminococcus sp.]|nr:hypothetical protein [Ruminococcus sp.]
MGFGDAQNGQHSWTLGEEQLIMLYKLCDLQSASSADGARRAYKAVFKDVVTMVAEIQE